MGTRRGRVIFSVFVFIQFRRGSTQRPNKTNSIFLVFRGISFIVVVAIGGDFEKQTQFAFENLLGF